MSKNDDTLYDAKALQAIEAAQIAERTEWMMNQGRSACIKNINEAIKKGNRTTKCELYNRGRTKQDVLAIHNFGKCVQDEIERRGFYVMFNKDTKLDHNNQTTYEMNFKWKPKLEGRWTLLERLGIMSKN